MVIKSRKFKESRNKGSGEKRKMVRQEKRRIKETTKGLRRAYRN